MPLGTVRDRSQLGRRFLQVWLMASVNCKVAVSLFKRTLCLGPAQKPGGQRSLLTISSRLQERGLKEGRTVHKCFSPHSLTVCKLHSVTLPRQDSMSDSLRTCYKYLNETSRSFAAVIQALDGELRHAVCIFYLVLRALDTVEDDMTISLEKKIPILHNFHTYLYQADWRFTESKEKDRQVLEDFPTISLEFRSLAVVYQDVIADICHKMGVGMAEFLEKQVESLLEWDKYCHYVAGLVGIGLSRLFSASELEDAIVGEDTRLSNSMGLFLQKTNIIRDYLEDQLEGREFWPREVWSKYGKKLSDLAKPENIVPAVQCLNELVTNALQHVPDVLLYLSRLRNQSVFNFCAIPQIYQKIPLTDPSSGRTHNIISTVQKLSLSNGPLVSRNNFSPIYLSCAMLLAALSWQYLSTVQASEEVHTGQ
ncbi:squalene synthase isoform X2 [Dendropsophus ebraccatus]|uniref:squalene synthase isoform X2 n=1 Tax=Dendropsophus ebraccatus TaxID=150705 RepID=UPI0038313974